MDHRFSPRVGKLFFLGASLALVHCASPSSDDADDDRMSAAVHDEAEQVGTQSSAVVGAPSPAKCFAKMLMPAPYDNPDVAVGLSMTVRVNRACDRGAPLVDRKVRVYIRRYETNGTIGPQVMLKDWTDVAASQYRLDIPWAAGAAADGSTLSAGRYQIYAYSIDASLFSAWVAGDPAARAASIRSDNTYVVLKAGGTWTPAAWGSCSASCGGGTQTRTSACKDGGGADIDPRYCVASAPASSQACNEQACPPSPQEQCNIDGGFWDGFTCQLGGGPDPMMDCMMTGGMWNGFSCDYGPPGGFDPMMDCMMSGGMWMGGYCSYGPPGGDPVSDCYAQGGAWNGITNTCEY